MQNERASLDFYLPCMVSTGGDLALDVYLEFIKKSFQQRYTYRANSYIRIFGTLLTLFITMIDRGRIIYDGSLASFKEKYSGGYMLTIELANENTNIVENRFKIIKEEGPKKRILFDKKEISVAEAITLITRSYDITDLTLKEPNIEEIVKKIYENNSVSESVIYSRGE